MTQVWAHRGASADAPENTLPAFELALAQGAQGLEFDVQLTRDDEVVVIHDETLERTTDGHGWVADHSLDQLRALDAGVRHKGFAGTRIPTLGEVLDLTRGTGVTLNIELKNSKMRYKGMEERVVEILAGRPASGPVVLSSFNHYSLLRLHDLDRGLTLGALYSERLYRPWDYVPKLKATALHPPARAVRGPKFVRRCAHAGLSLHVWTVDVPAEVRRLADLGVDAVITNHPARALAAL